MTERVRGGESKKDREEKSQLERIELLVESEPSSKKIIIFRRKES